MTILLYDRSALEERASRHLKAWKVCHLMLYALAAVFGIMNYVFLQNTMALVNNNCVLYPKELEFRLVEILDAGNDVVVKIVPEDAQSVGNSVQNDTKVQVKRDVTDTNNDVTTESSNATILNEPANLTHRWILDTTRTLFESDSTCQFAEYMPIMSTILAGVWLTMFTMCAGGGYVRTGLPQPWRILSPALIFAMVMVGLTGHSFTITNGGLHDFCGQFYEYTNTTACSAVNPFLERAWNTTWGMGERIAATRAASAGAWASWACAAALLLARCLTAADFQVRRTGVYLRDPQQKITPYLKKSPKPKSRSSNSSPTKRDNVSMRSEPTLTELVTVSIEQGQDSVPTSLMATPVKNQRNTDMIEMTYSPRERVLEQR